MSLEPDNINQEIIVNANMQIWQIVVQISRAFNLRISEFEIVTKKGPLDQSIYYTKSRIHHNNTACTKKWTLHGILA